MKPTLIDPAQLVPQSYTPPPAPLALPEYREPKQRTHPMLVAFLATGDATGAFYGAEMLAPVSYKPSAIIGGYEGAMAQARKQGELRAQIRYEGQLKQIETAAVQWQEQYKAKTAGLLQYYQAVYTRAGTYAQASVDIQKQYLGLREQLAISTTAGNQTWANMADLAAPFLSVLDPAMGESATSFAERQRQIALEKLNQAAQSGVMIRMDGWDIGLEKPEVVAQALQELPMLKLPPTRAEPSSR